MIKYFFLLIGIWFIFSCSEGDPIEPPIDPPGPGNPTSAIATPGIRIRVSGGKQVFLLSKCIATGRRKYSHVLLRKSQ